ncbi:ABC transporter ATP-binding protein [Xinfangfangia sp. CPCC 101601]|uniref:ABC transporter ATP-binding protein n=1 Tax=Pseudogemmobacter lacusdianii TaxID=3069608 RepID=A0ABU0W0T2_9RHOB|nr:ABC transporter ATP-binding protein [Xinfangfangia sp. CPCC 101601]MDQ2067621.1 ABC transporter ATP-binding protein [Xinfangfangia sp. CPCC 101601]
MTAPAKPPLYVVENLRLDMVLPGGPLALLQRSDRRVLNILDDISLQVERGETLGLVGESGSGKTTLARAMLGLLPISSGKLSMNGQELTPGNMAQLRRATAMMFQDPIASLSPRMRVGDLVTEPFIIHGPRPADRAATARALLAQVGLPPEMAQRYPHELSGGQARRVCTARALALEPAFVIADEPTAGLDVSVQGEILNLLADLKEQRGISFLIITHNLAVIRHTSDRIGILYLGRLVESGPTREVFRAPAHPYTASLIASEPDPDPRRRRQELAIKGEIPSLLRRPSGCEFHSRCPIAEVICHQTRPSLRQIAPGRSVRCHLAG